VSRTLGETSAGGTGERVVREPRVPRGPATRSERSERRGRRGGCGERATLGAGAPRREATGDRTRARTTPYTKSGASTEVIVAKSLMSIEPATLQHTNERTYAR